MSSGERSTTPISEHYLCEETKGQLSSDLQSENTTTPPIEPRRNSVLSENSNESELKSPVLTYDSGNYSSSSNVSELTCPFEAELHNHCQQIHVLLRERNQGLSLAMQDVRKLRSELERCSKSEEWYKKELRSQKTTRLETLERLYTQERRYMQENQRLQRECLRLYEKCGLMEKELQMKQDDALRDMNEKNKDQLGYEVGDGEPEISSTFESEQQKLLVEDQQKLINLLRKQKQSLLGDLSRLNEEKDAKVMELQQTLAGLEVENTHMTAQCKRLLLERQSLSDTLQLKDAELVAENAEKLKMRILIEELKQQAAEQQEMLECKEREIREIQEKFKSEMQSETNMDEVHRLSLAHHIELNAKTAEITALKKSLQAVQNEMDALADRQAEASGEQERQLEQLNITLEAQNCELTNLQETDVDKTKQISELQKDLEKMRNQQDRALVNLHSAQSELKTTKQELIVLHGQYADMCALCERTRFELDLLEIEKGRLNFQAESDKHEIEKLREKLKNYLRYTEELGARISELEGKLSCVEYEKGELQMKLKELEKRTIIEHTEERDVKLEQSEIETESAQIHANDDDSGFLDITKDTFCENRDMNELQAANEALLGHLGTQEKILNERRKVIGTFKALLCNNTKAPSDENKEHDRNNLAEKADFIALLVEGQKQLMEHLNDQCQITVEKKQILEAFETLINREIDVKETSIKDRDVPDYIFEKNNLPNENENKLILQKENETLANNDFLEDESTKPTELEKRLKSQSEELENLQKKLLETDEKHMQSRRDEEQKYKAHLQACEDAMRRLQTENERLAKDLEEITEAKVDMERELEKQNHALLEFKAKLKLLETIKSQESEPQTTQNTEKEELFNLRRKVEELEERLLAAKAGEEERRYERIRLIRKLLEQQNSKVKQLTESQEQWEELLAALHAAQALEENTRAELRLKHAQLEELNALFAEQNEELRKLHKHVLLGDDRALEGDVNELRLKYQTEIEQLQTRLNEQLAESERQQRKIEELQSINERLERRLNEDYAQEVANNQKQLRTLQNQIDQLQAERNNYAERLTEMEMEMHQLKKSKREALMLPPEFAILPLSARAPTAETSTSSCDDGNAGLDGSSDSENSDRMRILTKVLEAEYRRKMKRYDLHIHTLLGNVKKLKKSLRSTEQRAAYLTMEQSRAKEELSGLQMTRRQLEEMRLKCEQNQGTIKALEQALEMERKKFEASDLGKAITTQTSTTAVAAQQRDEPAHEVANLIDDYKKLIKQSALATQRPKTSAILELIQRSQQCVPNLNKLETSIDGLRIDLDYLLSSHVSNMRQQQQQQQHASKLDGPSLLEELRAATESC